MRIRTAILLLGPLFLAVAGCGGSPTTGAIQAAMAQLSPEDRKLAEAQKFCAVEEDNLLGKMGKPIKVMLHDKPVFLCCKSCLKIAEREPDKTLATAEALNKKAAGTPDQ